MPCCEPGDQDLLGATTQTQIAQLRGNGGAQFWFHHRWCRTGSDQAAVRSIQRWHRLACRQAFACEGNNVGFLSKGRAVRRSVNWSGDRRVRENIGGHSWADKAARAWDDGGLCVQSVMRHEQIVAARHLQMPAALAQVVQHFGGVFLGQAALRVQVQVHDMRRRAEHGQQRIGQAGRSHPWWRCTGRYPAFGLL